MQVSLMSISYNIKDILHNASWSLKKKKKKFEMFQTIISFKNLIPPVLKLAYVKYIKLKSRHNI